MHITDRSLLTLSTNERPPCLTASAPPKSAPTDPLLPVISQPSLRSIHHPATTSFTTSDPQLPEKPIITLYDIPSIHPRPRTRHHICSLRLSPLPSTPPVSRSSHYRAPSHHRALTMKASCQLPQSDLTQKYRQRSRRCRMGRYPPPGYLHNGS